jgi:chemotaxis protein MotB
VQDGEGQRRGRGKPTVNKDREVPIRIVYRNKRHHGYHGGAWKVAFADFMTSMFALFLVLWLINQSSDVKSAIAGYFQDPLGRANEYGSSILPGDGAQASTVRALTQTQVVDLRRDRLQQVAERLRQRLEQSPDLSALKQFVEIELVDDGLQIQLLEDSTGVFFETGKSTPSLRGQEILAMLGSELGALPNRVRIEGYTDARPYVGSRTYSNWELSADRANAARRLLTTSGLPARQVSEIRGLADRQLRVPENPFADSNRRVTITVLLATTARSPGAAADSTKLARLAPP